MKKTLLLTVAAIFMAAYNIMAQDAVLSANDLTATTLSENLVTDIFTIYATSSKTVTIDSNSKTFDDESYTQRIKFGGAGSIGQYRCIGMTVTGPCTVYVAALSSSSSYDRTYGLYDSKGNAIGTATAYGTSTGYGDTFTYTGEGEELFVYSEASINVYGIKVTYTTSTAITSTTSDSEILSTEYYTLSGAKVTEPVKGITIVKEQLSDGTVRTSKIVK